MKEPSLTSRHPSETLLIVSSEAVILRSFHYLPVYCRHDTGSTAREELPSESIR